MNPDIAHHPLTQLPPEDLDLIVRLVLASGSLKELGRHYGVSYPTIRARLDGVIARLQGIVEGRTPDPVIDQLAELVEAGELSISGARRIRKVYLERLGDIGGEGNG